MEMEVEVDGETFGHGAVDERDALEAVAHSGLEFIEAESASLFDEVGAYALRGYGFERGNGYSCL